MDKGILLKLYKTFPVFQNMLGTGYTVPRNELILVNYIDLYVGRNIMFQLSTQQLIQLNLVSTKLKENLTDFVPFKIPYRKYTSQTFAEKIGVHNGLNRMKSYSAVYNPNLIKLGFLCTGEQTMEQKLQTLTAEVSLKAAKDHCSSQNSLLKSEWSYEEHALAHTVKKQTAKEFAIPWLKGMSAYWTGAVRVGDFDVKFENGTGNLRIFTCLLDNKQMF